MCFLSYTSFLSKGLFINYVIFFWDHSRPLPPPLSSCVRFWHTPPYPLPDGRENYISMIGFFLRQTLTAHGDFSSGSNFWCLWGEWFDFHCYISMVRVSYSAVSVFSLLPPASSSSSVIFCQTPSHPSVIWCHLLAYPLYPLIGWCNLWTAPNILAWASPILSIALFPYLTLKYCSLNHSSYPFQPLPWDSNILGLALKFFPDPPTFFQNRTGTILHCPIIHSSWVWLIFKFRHPSYPSGHPSTNTIKKSIRETHSHSKRLL